MTVFIKSVMAVIILLLVNFGAMDMVDSTPNEALSEFMQQVKSVDEKGLQAYGDSEYVNFLLYAQGEEDKIHRVRSALFRNFSYKTEQIVIKGNEAAAKVSIIVNDFSKVRRRYDKISYDYVTDNLYEEKIPDKKWLQNKLFEIYVEEVEKAAEKKPVRTEIILAMIGDGYGGWDIHVTDKTMKKIMGGLTIP